MIDVTIPAEFVEIASRWYNGMDDLLYAVASTGGLTRGSIRPRDDDGNPLSDIAWLAGLWESLDHDIRRALRYAERGFNGPGDADDAETLRQFAEFAYATSQAIWASDAK